MKTNVFDFCVGSCWDYNTSHNFDGLITSIRSEFEYIGCGRTRIVFVHNDRFVIKVPKSIWGLTDNWHEASVCSNEHFCNAKLLHNVLLIMERVSEVNGIQLPSWTYGIDCQQVGITRSGKLKAYDFGLH